MLSKPTATDPKLLALLEKAKHHKMTRGEMDVQRKSWVKGEMMLEHEDMTAEQFEALWSSIHIRQAKHRES